MSFHSPRSFLSPDFIIRAAARPWELNGLRQLRHQVFVEEQGIFDTDDRDAIDDIALPLVAISTFASEADQVVGCVRIHEAAPRVWRGSRLAVAQSHRRMGRLGAELIRLAVCTAHGRGCDRFLAQVQMQNVALFRRLHWAPLREIEVHGVAHMEMQADLAAYPPILDPFAGWTARSARRRAA
ncbi:MSMEG_0567/Sll0786 family nitrogen starvation N-acetyltransferase [Jannaschia sp. M317]|uniref:MSMEG_0567/Sll0786 family nitrogen starvation N-acetyltransferase n=1 Tax=Jannaschia sp. M317 TaxID=2867011 RepID=UPI0021A77E44|nr:MSMEG_0567/Sll0786 family nitrogen starvation N-acetyltransferase [Jannaschia sp. M317]UWQ17461.1 GNAT family N-acetyltransferase [Jannaschia sp. M317]